MSYVRNHKLQSSFIVLLSSLITISLLFSSGAIWAVTAEMQLWPKPARDQKNSRILPEVTVAGPADNGTPYQRVKPDGSPVSWDPCRPIHYTISTYLGSRDLEQIVFKSVARMENLTGLSFVYDGLTDEIPTSERSSLDVERYGNRWSPVLIGWSNESKVKALEGSFIGEAYLLDRGVASSIDPGSKHYVSGRIALDTTIKGLSDELVSTILLHELGHLVGLDHNKDEESLMYLKPSRENGPVSMMVKERGDLISLAKLGKGQCYPLG